MDGETLVTHCVFMATDLCLLGLFYKLYKNKSDCLKALQEAKPLEINNELLKTVNSAGGVIPYAVLTGHVKALATPIRSQHFNYLRGVIYERITKEQKLKWSPFFHIWNSSENAIQRNEITIPFGLYGGGFFKKQVVEVVDPLLAQELVLTEVYDDFKSYKESISDMLVGFFRGEHKIGTLEVENMLLEDTPLTAVGKLVIENDKLKIMPPGNSLVYFLTPSSFDSLIQRIKDSATLYKGLAYICASIAITLLIYYSKKGYIEVKRRIDHANQLKRRQRERLLRRKEDSFRKTFAGESPKCIVCLENPVEILILECGHICLCINCSERFNDNCPVCRSKIQRLVPAFLP